MSTLRTFSKRISSLALVTLAVLSLPGCMGDADNFVDENTGEAGDISFDDFVASEVTYDEATGHYVVEGDIIMNDLEDVERYWAENLQPGALTIHTLSLGARDRWSDAQKFDISYCIDKNGFSTSQYAEVQAAMRVATAEWEKSAMVNFNYKSDQDSNCADNGSLNNNVKFEVHFGGDSGTTTASMNFPNERGTFERELMVYRGAWNASPKTLTGILMHELGHGLGFPHEHNRTSCATDASSDVEELTDLDVESVMFYRQLTSCGATWRDYSLSTSDRNGAALVYGAPAPSCPSAAWNMQGPNDKPFLCTCNNSGFQWISMGGPNYPLDPRLSVCSAAYSAGAIPLSGGSVLVTKKSDAPGPLCTWNLGSGGQDCNYDSWGSFTVAAPTVIPACPTDMTAYRGTYAERVCQCANGGSGSVWGTGTYTDDSNVCRAAMHAGVILSTGGLLRVAATAGASSYTGTTQNGVTTLSYSSWPGSFTVKSAPAITSWSLDYHGGSGGGSYGLSCNTGSVAVGLNVRAGSYVDRIEPVCAPVSADLSLGTTYTIGSAGGSGGGQTSLTCPTNEALVGIYGRSGNLLDRIGIRCQSLSSFKLDRTSAKGSFAGGSGGVDFDNVCPKGFAIKSFWGSAGSYVDALQAECVAIP